MRTRRGNVTPAWALPGEPHALPAARVLEALRSDLRGLGAVEASTRAVTYGPNAIPREPPPGILSLFARQFLDPLIYVLIAAAGVSAATRSWSDAGLIVMVLIANAVIGTVQESGAQRSAEALASLLVARARVIRDGEDGEIEAVALVPGDLVVLEAGDKVPADVRLVSGGPIEVDESLLTGESFPATKRVEAVLEPGTPLGDRANLAFAGTLTTRGRAVAVVVAIGPHTQLGRIAGAVGAATHPKAPLLVRMGQFSKRIAALIGGAVLLLGAVDLARGTPGSEVLLLVVALAVSAIPEGLPVALTVALSIGARRMARRKVIARRLVAVEALGSCTFIASDKTGTLTLNQLTTSRLAIAGQEPWELTGGGIEPSGAVLLPKEGVDAVAARAVLTRIGQAIALCNDGFLGRRDEAWTAHGDAVDVALLVAAHKLGITRAEAAAAAPREAEIRYEPERQYAATLNRVGGGLRAHVKGAAERILPMCARMATLSGDAPLDPVALERAADRLAAEGHRVLAVAAGPVRLESGEEFEAEHLRELVFLGFAGMIDPLRPEALASVAACRRAGIQVSMVTGDHPVTALAIARQLGIAGSSDPAVTGPALAASAEEGTAAFDARVRDARVFARVEPNQKLQIVQSLIRLGHFVAVTGDGANDAPALRAANIGVAMGLRGTDVARESADLILADDDFSSIVAGVEEGRVAYANVRKVIFLLISTGAAEILLFVMAVVAGGPLPLLPAQLLWLNLVTNGIQDVALAFEPGEGGELVRPPRAPGEPIFDRSMIERTLVSAAVVAGVGFAAFAWMLRAGWGVAAARNGLLLLMVLFENVHAGNSRSETRSVFTMNPLRNRLLAFGMAGALLVHVAAMYAPGLSALLRVAPVPPAQWAATIALALSLLVAMELYKLARRGPDRRGS